MQEPRSAYVYDALPTEGKWTRLLILHPGSPSESLSVSLRRKNLETPCKYDALSYTWGDMENTTGIVVDEDYILQITHDLSVALRHLRHTSEERVLWVDAVCINQQDGAERSAQVAQMYSIYQNAQTVEVWVGPEGDDSNLAIQQLEAIGSTVQLVWLDELDWLLVPRDSSDYAQILADDTALLEFSERTWDALLSFFNRPWFERLWIRQEIHPANMVFFNRLTSHPIAAESAGQEFVRTIEEPLEGQPGMARLLCGARSMSWWSLRNAITCFQKKRLHHALGPTTSTAMQATRQRLGLIEGILQLGFYSWASLVRDLRTAKCSDPRDRIFAVMGMMEGRDSTLSITPDYTKPAIEVFRDVTVSHINTFRCLDMLRHCAADGTNLSLHPSWIPDFARGAPVHLGFHDRGLQFSASSHLYSDVRCLGNNAIQVLGVKIDSIDALYPPFADADNSTDDQIDKQCWEKLIPAFLQGRSLQDTCPGGGSYLNALVDILTFRKLAESSYPAHHLDPKREPSKLILEALISGTFEGSRGISKEYLREFFKLQQNALVTTFNYGLFRTSKGYLGMAPRWARQEDCVAVLLGSEIPFILRRVVCSASKDELSASCYHIVAPCYIHGFMDGEALLGSLPPNQDTVTNNKGGVRTFRNTTSGSQQLADPRILTSFPKDRLGEYMTTLSSAMSTRFQHPKLKVDKKDLEALGVQAEAIRLV